MPDSWLIPLSVLLPLVFAAWVACAPGGRARGIALLGSLVSALPVLAIGLGFRVAEGGAATQFAGAVEAMPSLGLTLSWGLDGVTLLLVLLSAFLVPICVLASWSGITERPRLFYAWLLILASAMIGVFAARDLLLFYICFEFTLLPMFVLISVYGSTERKRAGVKFFLYTFTGSLITLAGLVYVVWQHQGLTGAWTMDIASLAATARGMSRVEQGWVLLALLAGFAVKVPLFPVHTWLPLAHTEAPTAGSVILAGVLLKLGTYGVYRFALGFVPDAVTEHAGLIAILSIVGIVYAGLVCWVQQDVKKLIAYSSVSHLGFCVLGLVALNSFGLQGSVLYMVNHGLSTGALFCCIGFMYERYHTRDMRQLQGLARTMPVWACFMVFFTMASVGLPGLNGFVSEFLCLIGTFQSGAATLGPAGVPGPLGPVFAVVAGTGMVVAAMYLLYMVGKVVFGPPVEPAGHHHPDPDDVRLNKALPADLSAREIATLTVLALPCVFLGLYPKPAINAIDPAARATLAAFEAVPSERDQSPVAIVPAARGQTSVAEAAR